MKKVIDGKVYNTDTAELVHTYEPYYDSGDFNYFIEELYVTKKGNYFIAGEGGARSAYSTYLGNGSTGGGSAIRPISLEEAVEWLEETGGDMVLIDDSRFSEQLEEA